MEPEDDDPPCDDYQNDFTESSDEHGVLEFQASNLLTVGVELELQLIDRRTGDLTRCIRPDRAGIEEAVSGRDQAGDHREHARDQLLDTHLVCNADGELMAMRNTLVAGADRLDIEVAGGGAHPFQRWYDRQIYDRPRFRHVAGLYGYLAKQFTVFGQHVHIGCENGTQALWLLHRLSSYIPQFIALAAASPYFQGVDTSYDCSR